MLQTMGSQSWTRLKRPSVHARIGEGNGSTLQCSYLENPRTGEAGGLPFMGSHRVGTRMKRLSSSSNSDL